MMVIFSHIIHAISLPYFFLFFLSTLVESVVAPFHPSYMKDQHTYLYINQGELP